MHNKINKRSEQTYPNWRYSRKHSSTDNPFQKIGILAVLIRVITNWVYKACLPEQSLKLSTKRMHDLHSWKWQKVLPTVIDGISIIHSFFPSIIRTNKGNVITAITSTILESCCFCNLHRGHQKLLKRRRAAGKRTFQFKATLCLLLFFPQEAWKDLSRLGLLQLKALDQGMRVWHP